VLVIGAGIAGAAAAIAAADQGASVLCVTKSEFEEANTAWAQGGVAAALRDDDSPQRHAIDTLRVGAGMSDPSVVELVTARARDTVRWLEDLGARFDRDGEGDLALGREGGHSTWRVVHANGDSTGREIQRILAHRLTTHPNVICKVGPFVRDLLVHEGRCVGAVILDGESEFAVHAGAVILATGGAGQVFRETTNPSGACGDGVALGFRAGAKLADMEFVQFHPTVLYIAGASRFLISEVVRGAGAWLLDRSGARFMQEVHRDAELAPRDVVSRAILDRMVATSDTHVYLDLTHVSGDPHLRFPSISRICKAFDIDIARDPIPVRPGAHYMIGGVVTQTTGRSSVDGLWAVGEAASSGLHGANRLASNSLLEGAVLGELAGRDAAMSHTKSSLPPTSMAMTTDGDSPPLHLDDVLYSLKSLMWRQVGLNRSAVGLAESTERIGLWHRYVERARRTTRRAYELQNMLTVSALVATGATLRTESRGTHFRSDHGMRDDANWCRRIVMRRSEDGTIATHVGPLLEPSDRDTEDHPVGTAR
jgi:L-aspartate oxidase